jgi:cation transport ATPase
MSAKVERPVQRVTYRCAAALAIVAVLLLVWLSLGVGIIGSDGDPANRMYAAVVAVGVVGALLARLRARGLARTLFAMALVQALVAVIAVTLGLGLPWSGPAEVVLLNAFFVACFAAAGWLFRRAARSGTPRAA